MGLIFFSLNESCFDKFTESKFDKGAYLDQNCFDSQVNLSMIVKLKKINLQVQLLLHSIRTIDLKNFYNNISIFIFILEESIFCNLIMNYFVDLILYDFRFLKLQNKGLLQCIQDSRYLKKRILFANAQR